MSVLLRADVGIEAVSPTAQEVVSEFRKGVAGPCTLLGGDLRIRMRRHKIFLVGRSLTPHQHDHGQDIHGMPAQQIIAVDLGSVVALGIHVPLGYGRPFKLYRYMESLYALSRGRRVAANFPS